MTVGISGDKIVNFYPEHHLETLEEVLIHERREAESTQDRDILSGIELEETRGKSLGESLKSITGVTTLNTGASIAKPVIHGLHSNRILILNNGIRQEGQQWGSEHAPSIDPFVADKLTVVKGAEAVRYGSDAIGGVVLVEPKDLPRTAGTHTTLHAVGMENGWQSTLSAKVEGGMKSLPGIGWRLQGTFKKGGDVHTSTYNLSNTGLQENNVSAAFGYNTYRHGIEVFFSRFDTELGILRASHIGNLTDLTNAIEQDEPYYVEDFTFKIEPPRQEITHHLSKIKAYVWLDKLGKLSLQYGGQYNSRKEFDRRRGGRDTIPVLDLALRSHSLDAFLAHNPLGRLKLNGGMGVSAFYQRNFNVPGTGFRPLIPNYRSYSVGAFMMERLTKERWELEAGARYDLKYLRIVKFDGDGNIINPDYLFHNTSFTLGGLYHLTKKLTWKANASTAFRPPQVNELFSEGLHQASAAIEEGNENLSPERALKAITTLEYAAKDWLQLEASLYYNLIFGYIYLEPQAEPRLTIRGAFPVFLYKQTDVRIWGVDAAIQFQPLKGLFVKGKVSILRAWDRLEDNYIINMPADQFEQEIRYEREEVGKFSLLYASIGLKQLLQQIRFPEGIDFLDPPDGYMLLQAKVGMTLPIAKKHTLSLNLQGENLLNTSYRDYLNRFRYYADEMGRNISLRIQYTF